MQQINPFHEEATWAADELVKIAKSTEGMPLKDRISLLKEICDRGGLVKGSAVTKRVLTAQYVITDPANESRKLMSELDQLEATRRAIDERLKGVLPCGDDDGADEGSAA